MLVRVFVFVLILKMKKQKQHNNVSLPTTQSQGDHAFKQNPCYHMSSLSLSKLSVDTLLAHFTLISPPILTRRLLEAAASTGRVVEDAAEEQMWVETGRDFKLCG